LIRIVILATLTLFFISGCAGYRTIEVPMDEGTWNEGALQPERMYTRQEEGKYVIKEEPYSLKSRKKDPELLGPQRTYDHNSRTVETVKKHKTSSTENTMTKDACISLIGEAKYNSYVKKYGSEKGALRRCLIIKRLRG